MFFSGEPSRQKKVDLGGRSSKERERQRHVQQTKFAREQRQRFRQQILSALVIQKCFRGRREALAAKSVIRKEFCLSFGENGGKDQTNAFKPSLKYFHQLLFFFSANDHEDILRLLQACKLLHQSVQVSGNLLDIFTNGDYHCSSDQAIIQYRVKRFAFCCLQAVHQNMEQLKSEHLRPSGNSADSPGWLLLETVISLIDSTLPWAGNTMDYILHRHTFRYFRELTLTLQGIQTIIVGNELMGLDYLLTRLASHSAQKLIYSGHNMQLSFPAQILSIPFLWKRFPNLKQVVMSQGLWPCYIQHIATVLPSLDFLPADTTPQLPSHACLLGNVLEMSGFALSTPNCTLQTAMNFANIASFLLEEIPYNFMPSTAKESDNDMEESDDDMEEDEDQIILSKDLEKQIFSAIDIDFLKQLVRFLNGDMPGFGECTNSNEEPSSTEAAVVTAVCRFLHVSITMLPLENVMLGLAYTTELVPTLWQYMKRTCHLSQKWPSTEVLIAFSLQQEDALSPCWLLPLSVFCPLYRHMLMITDNEEFYQQQKPLSLQDVKELINILKETLWELLWVIPSKSVQPVSSQKKVTRRERVSMLVAELLEELQDWNCRREFISPDVFYARDAIEGRFFYMKAGNENPIARELLKRAPFLVPFKSRVQIYTSLLDSARQQNRNIDIDPSERHRITIRRNQVIEDAYRELNGLTREQLRGIIRVKFVNEFGLVEAGVDGGGMFKDFMEKITKTAFDIQCGFFKETADHLLYPNPVSATIHSEHLQYFEFIGKVLGKAMFEGILVDIPFATFFLTKLKEKHICLHDLLSLDPELYRSLMSLKNYDGDVSQLGLYFVCGNNEYGEQKEEELLPGGKHMPVTNENVISFINLWTNHRLNIQIHDQSSSFLRGLRQLIPSDWLDMFNKHELQLLISGSTQEGQGIDVDDLRSNIDYSGGYDADDPIIEMLWEVIKELNVEQQKKFLKFVTGCSRAPLLGFRYLDPLFCIRRAAQEAALDRLPTAATCVNLLVLPPYSSKEVLRAKLLYAISADAGFEFM